MDHSRAPVLEALAAFQERRDVVYGPPGHKQGRGADPRLVELTGEGVFASDALSLNGRDDRRESQGVVSQAEDLMADAVGTRKAFFSTCGSSLSVKAAVISVAGPGEKLLISPTDWGTCADIAGTAEVCHAFGVPLIVDEAWGAHLPFHPDLPSWGTDAGADVVVTSVHKTGGAIEQSSVFHLQGDLVNPDVLKEREDLLGTTSSSALVHLTLDGWRRQVVEQGRELLGSALERAARVRSAVDGIDGLDLVGREVVRPQGAFDLDPLALTIDVRPLGISGYQAGDWLRANCHVDAGSADACRIGVRLTHADDDETERRLVESLRRLTAESGEIERQPETGLPQPGALEPRTAMTPRDAFFARAERVPIQGAVGRVVAELFSPYPPGVPVLAPGEVVDQQVVDYLTTGAAAGMLVPDAADPVDEGAARGRRVSAR
ncbi:hypothetical protein MO973_36375 [Paenibacillus sp. TRM 82003]|uniref:aminotransferase class I/II-fold pyridoxal phosphate-dependent enzyme n=1 Tax=Kineococcus sp. TRM81007 TaxID=2925831 RepID=UPI001F570F88|nr:ornithine decarboxylase [Kineococcus sp. TRM81007]MCI2240005.1 ornithine decarboxylase [Kineococcus sp. TRM81007]MCI3925690.1 hypothetical protein [Paenibacillus sp. TRM 82003]